MHCNLRPPDVAPVTLGYFWSSLLHIRTICYFLARCQNFGIAITLSDTDFLEKSNNLTIKRNFRCYWNTFIRTKTTQQTGDRLCTAEQHEMESPIKH